MSNADALQGFDYDPRNGHFHYGTRLSWPLQHSESPSSASAAMIPKRSDSPMPLPLDSNSYHQTATYPPATSIMAEWQMSTQTAAVSYPLDTTSFSQQPFDTFGAPFQTSPTDYLNQQTTLETSLDTSMNTNMNAGMPMSDAYIAMANSMHAGINDLQSNMNPLSNMPINWTEDPMALYNYHNMQNYMAQQQQQPSPLAPSSLAPMGSPSETYISDNEGRSLSSDWNLVDRPNPHALAIFNPQETLHPRTWSDSSSDIEQHSHHSCESYVEVLRGASSPSNDSNGELTCHSDPEHSWDHVDRKSPPSIMTNSVVVQPISTDHSIAATSPQRSPTSPAARNRPRKGTGTKSAASTKGISKKAVQAPPKEGEKRVGRRKGPLRPDQRKQASEIRKLGACIRCRFLKKTCDKGDPCAGCQPSHARLWLVPCTRIDIKDLGYFLKDWKADYERHVSLGFSVGNIKGFSDKENTLFVTHGYGHYLPVQAREVFVRDDRVFGLNWVETKDGIVSEHEVNTARLSAGMEGISTAMLSDYLDRHIDGNFEFFVDDYFQGSPFFPEILKTVYRFWQREKTPVIRKALKFVLAYNLTQAICLVKTVGAEQEILDGTIPEESYYYGSTAAPVMINFQVKCAMADMWRELQKDVLEELSTLYSSIYSRDKLKHWPTIFMLATVLLVVWEEMQFDCRYRIPDEKVVEKFCKDMESTPVGVIVGLFSAISQKVPAFTEWDTRKHHLALNSNAAVCTAMEEVRDQISQNDDYLRSRSQAKFDRYDFDCLSNIFVSKLVIRAH